MADSTPAQEISSVPENQPVMVYLPVQGGWFRCIVAPPAKDGIRYISISGQVGKITDMHGSLTTAHATHWQPLSLAPLEASEEASFMTLVRFCIDRGLPLRRTASGSLSVTRGSETKDFTGSYRKMCDDILAWLGISA
jgi:hypothetical protein